MNILYLALGVVVVEAFKKQAEILMYNSQYLMSEMMKYPNIALMRIYFLALGVIVIELLK